MLFKPWESFVEFSVSRARTVQQFDYLEQSVFVAFIPKRSARQIFGFRFVDGNFRFNDSALDARKFGRLAIRLPLRDGFTAVDFRYSDRK